MEAKRAANLPHGKGWLYEPKWDGFRVLVFRAGDRVVLQSKSGQPLERYFPEVVERIAGLLTIDFVLDGEIVIARGDEFSFDDLLLRIHPTASRVRKLAAETPASLIVFDLLAEGDRDLSGLPLAERRRRLEQLMRLIGGPDLRLSPGTEDDALAETWFESIPGLEGVMAKRLDLPYRSGRRDGMVKIKKLQSADCGVGGFRYLEGGKLVGSLLLGLYGDDGLLHHVGMTSAFTAQKRAEITAKVEPLAGGEGFTGNAPGGPSRWSGGKENPYVPLRPELVCEVQYDYFNQGRFRHGTKFLRWRPDKAPRACTFEQVG